MTESKKIQYLSAVAVSVAVLTTSAANFWTAPMVPKFYNNEISFNLTKSEISWMVAVISPGHVFGSLFSAKMSDRFGRRASMLGSALPYMIGTVIMLCATNSWMMYIARFFWGTGQGIISSVSPIYISEIADKTIRGKLTAGTRFMFSLGALLVITVGSYVSFQILTSLILVLPVSYFVACWAMPESPYYLLKEGKVDKAKKEYMRLCGVKDEKVVEENLELMRSDVKKEMLNSSTMTELLSGKQYRKACIISVVLRFTQIMAGSIAIQHYLGHIIQESNSGIDVAIGLVVFGSIRFVVGLGTPFVVDKIGRRPLLLISYFGVSIIYVLVGVHFCFFTGHTTSIFRYLFFVGLICANSISLMGFNTLVFIIPSEIFPLNVRSVAMTLLSIATAFFSFALVKTYQNMEDWIGVHGVFWYYASVCLIGGIFTYYVIPETKGKTLREIQIELQGNIYDETEEEGEKLNQITVNGNNNPTEELKDMRNGKSRSDS